MLYDWPCLDTISPASLLNATVAEGPHPLLVDKTSGVKSHAQLLEFISHTLSSSLSHVLRGGVAIYLLAHEH